MRPGAQAQWRASKRISVFVRKPTESFLSSQYHHPPYAQKTKPTGLSFLGMAEGGRFVMRPGAQAQWRASKRISVFVRKPTESFLSSQYHHPPYAQKTKPTGLSFLGMAEGGRFELPLQVSPD